MQCLYKQVYAQIGAAIHEKGIMGKFVDTRQVDHDHLRQKLRMPLQGEIELTDRCNNRCMHCWIARPENDPSAVQELTTAEIKDIVEQARRMGCREWHISGGEPMLRPDFAEIYKFILDMGCKVTLNTNGTLITPEIAELLKRPAVKMISIYGATAQTHDQITRAPGSFEAVMRGFRLLQQVGAKYVVQIMPMSANLHELEAMKRLAGSLSEQSRLGGSWLYLRADGDARKNETVRRMRVPAATVIELDPPSPQTEQSHAGEHGSFAQASDGLLFPCAGGQNHFHVDAYGHFSICAFLRHPECLYDLRRGSLREAWEVFTPRVKAMRGGAEYRENCQSCNLRSDCRWCSAYAFLEHQQLETPVRYLCEIAAAQRQWRNKQLRGASEETSA